MAPPAGAKSATVGLLEPSHSSRESTVPRARGWSTTSRQRCSSPWGRRISLRKTTLKKAVTLIPAESARIFASL